MRERRRAYTGSEVRDDEEDECETPWHQHSPPPPPRLPNNSSLSKTRAVYLLIIVKHHQVANAPLSSDHYPHIYDNLLCREDGAWRWPPGEQFFPDRFCATTGDRINFTVHNLAPQNRQAVDDLL